jgi:cytoskeletal protein CcmA (bactofilin family)
LTPVVRSLRRLLVSKAAPALALAALTGALSLPAPAVARDIGADDEVVITGTVRIPRGVHADRILIVDGRVDVLGHVDGVLFALDAPVHIGPHAVIDGDVISGAQKVTVERGATLNKDLVYIDEKPNVAPGARVYGEVRRADAGDFSLPVSGFLVHTGIWLAYTLSSLALGLALLWLAPRAADAALTTARERTGPAIGWGVGLFLGLPLIAIVAVLTLVGIPLGLVVLLALLPLYALGYVTTAYVLGRKLVSEQRGRIAAFLAGWAILRVVAFVPGLGLLGWLGATIFGLGLLTVTLWRSRGSATARPEPAPSAA